MGAPPITRRTALLMAGAAIGMRAKAPGDERFPILLYHRFGPTVPDSMTVRTATFENQLGVLKKQGFRAVPLGEVIERLRTADRTPEARPDARIVAITADDGHRSVYSAMWPILQQARVPVTLFIYPSAISNASYALSWAQLREMQGSGLAVIGSHTFWHPNFRQEKKRLPPEAYRQFVRMQLVRSKEVLEQRLATSVRWLAWPFGIHDDELMRAAEEAGYTAAFTIERRLASCSDGQMALPRLLMTEQDIGARFERLIGGT